MGDSKYKRVNRASPCQICGKPDWCSRTVEATISFCARVTTGADRLSLKQGWGVFYHDRELLGRSFEKRREPRNLFRRQPEEISLAPLEIRDFIYSALLRLSPASNYSSLTTGRKGLLERGLKKFEDYGGLPGSAFERNELAARLRILLNQTFPDFVRRNPHGIRHIPGFWINEGGEPILWQNRDFSEPFLIIPYRNPAGRIQACQIRFTGSLAANKKRYVWLSLPASGGASSGTPLHFAGWKSFGRENFFAKPLLVTEGALKADVVTNLHSNFFAIAGGGVSCSHELIVGASRGQDIYLAFDNDYQDNPAVVRQFARLLKLRLTDNQVNNLTAETKILAWSRRSKGIDDALLSGEKLDELTVTDWLCELNEASREEVGKIWEILNPLERLEFR